MASNLTRTPDIHRFMNMFQVDESTNCWNWTLSTDYQGYGQFKYFDYDKNKWYKERSNRASFKLFKGPITNGLCVLHHCDNPKCVNPLHLYLGTPRDNANDMVKRDRQRKGENHTNHKLTDEIVSWMRLQPEIYGCFGKWARMFEVNRATIIHAYRGKTWKHLD